MELAVKTLAGKAAGKITVDDAIFGIDDIRDDILQRTVRWQLAKRQAGTHKTKTRSEIARTTKKYIRQKGSGGARHGSRNAPIFVGGGTVFGPSPRSHAFHLPRKVRRGALRSALSQKVGEGKLKVVDSFVMEHPKTRQALAHLAALGVNRALVIDIDNETLKLSIRNVPTSKFLMTGGLNVRDLVHYDHVVITEAAVREIDGALKR